MNERVKHRLQWGVIAATLAASACDLSAERETPAPAAAAGLAVADLECGYDSVRPATGAPAEGLWVYEDRATLQRIAAMVGPAQTSAGRAHVTRRVETLESRPGTDTIRHAAETAVRLELIPPLARPAAVYPAGPLVLLASYEPCSAGLREPLIRYLRQDAQGHLATDVMLRRDAHP